MLLQSFMLVPACTNLRLNQWNVLFYTNSKEVSYVLFWTIWSQHTFQVIVNVDRHRHRVWTCIKRYNHLMFYYRERLSSDFGLSLYSQIILQLAQPWRWCLHFIGISPLQLISWLKQCYNSSCYNTLQSLVHCPMLYNLCVSRQTASESCVTTLPAWSTMRFWIFFFYYVGKKYLDVI